MALVVETPSPRVVIPRKEPDMSLLPCSYWSRCPGARRYHRRSRSRFSRHDAILEYMEHRRLLSGAAAGHGLERPETVIVASLHQEHGGPPAADPGSQDSTSLAAAHPGGP